jgi:hypothetical protein
MIPHLHEFKVEIKNLKFTTDAGKILPKTAIINYVDPEKAGKRTELFGYIDAEEIYKLIEEGSDVCLDHCYIDKLNLSEYRIMHEMGKKDYVKIVNFSAKHAIFNSRVRTDLSHVEFVGDLQSFEGTHFIKGDLSFNSSKFISGEVNFAYAVFNCDVVDFGNTHFGEGDVTFKNALFTKGTKDFQYADFGEGDVNFINTEFNDGDVSFINTVFGDGELSFKVARFGEGKLDFHYAKFGKGDISFERTEFGNGRVDFRKLEMHSCKVNFNRAIFGNGGITFEGCELKNGKFNFKKVLAGEGGLDFSLAEFENIEAYFDGTEIAKGSITFYNSKFEKLSLKSCHLDQYVDLRLQKANVLDLSDTIVRDIIDMKPYDFPVEISTVNFEGMRLIGNIYISWDDNKVQSQIESQKDTSLKSKADQFNLLKQNFNTTGQYDDEDESYVMFKRYEAKAKFALHKDDKLIKKIIRYPEYAFKWLVFDKVGLYATSPARVIVSIVFVYFFATLVFTIVPYFSDARVVSAYIDTEVSFISRFLASAYYTGITFFTVGYGEYTPTGILRLAAVLTAFVGVFMMSYFTVAFVRKILR